MTRQAHLAAVSVDPGEEQPVAVPARPHRRLREEVHGGVLEVPRPGVAVRAARVQLRRGARGGGGNARQKAVAVGGGAEVVGPEVADVAHVIEDLCWIRARSIIFNNFVMVLSILM